MTNSVLRLLILLILFSFRIFFFYYDVTACAVIAHLCPLVVNVQTHEIGVNNITFYAFSRESDGHIDVFR